MALFSASSSLTYHLAAFALNVIANSHPSILPFVVSPKLCSRPFTLRHVHYPLSLWSLPFPSTIIFMQMTRSFSSLSPTQLWLISHLQNALQHISSCMTANLSPVISLPSYALSTGSKLLTASNTSSSHLPTMFSQLPNLHTFTTSSLFNVLAVLWSYDHMALYKCVYYYYYYYSLFIRRHSQSRTSRS